jgi:asparagine synthase (glutamine-hydrolysing)
MDIGEVLLRKPSGDCVFRDKPCLRRVQFIKDIEHVPFETELPPVLEVLVIGEEGQREKVDRIHRKIDKRRENAGQPEDCSARHRMHQHRLRWFDEPAIQCVTFVAVDPHDDAASRLRMVRDIPERRRGIIRVMQNADGIDDIELFSQVHRGDVAFYQFHVGKFCRIFLSAFECVEVDARHFRRKRCNELKVLSAAASAVENGLSTEIFQGIRMDPLREEPLVIVVELVPLPCPLVLFYLHDRIVPYCYNQLMCGISGIIDLRGNGIDPSVLGRMTDALRHRGPEGQGVFIRGNVGLGHRRLKILDLSDAAHQPMMTEDQNIAITFNGEIYNFKELRSELMLRGKRFTSTGDTEVLLKLYEEYGDECVQKLRGQFAFVIFDGKRQRVLLVRDRVGKKPLKYFEANGVLAFASELKALKTLPQCPKGMDDEDIHHFLTMMYVPSPKTGLKDIKKLPAAHFMTIDLKTGKTEVKRYWELSYKEDTTRTLADWEKDVRETFEESVALRMVADVPVGAFLSGGIDSAAVVAAMSRLSTKPVETFTVGTAQETHNELPFAELIAKKFHTNHHPITVEPDIVHLLPELVKAYEEPFADPSVIPTYLIAQQTKRFVTVALNGDGGDENFAGYVRYPILKFSRVYGALPVHFFMRPLVKLFHAGAKSTLSYRSLRFEKSIRRPLAERQLQYLSFFTEEEKRSLYQSGKSPHQDTFAWYAAKTQEARSRGAHWLHQAMSADLDTYLAEDLLPKVDLGSMAHSLEARSPFLDHVLLELTARMPNQYKLRDFTTKWFLKHLLQDTIPAEILHKRKTGFRLPLDHWFRHDLKPFVVDRLLSKTSPLWAILDPNAVEGFLAQYYASNVDYSDHIWALLWLDEWMRQYT